MWFRSNLKNGTTSGERSTIAYRLTVLCNNWDGAVVLLFHQSRLFRREHGEWRKENVSHQYIQMCWKPFKRNPSNRSGNDGKIPASSHPRLECRWKKKGKFIHIQQQMLQFIVRLWHNRILILPLFSFSREVKDIITNRFLHISVYWNISFFSPP